MATQKIHVGAILAVATTVILVSVLSASLLAGYQKVPNNGSVKSIGVGVYWDGACTNNVTSIDWGFLDSGTTANRTVYIKNRGNISVILNMTTSSWNPSSASNYISLTWNRESYVLNTTVPVAQAVLTISVSSSISGITNFSFDMTITGTEQA